MESLPLRVDGPITGRSLSGVGGGLTTGNIFLLQVDGPITGVGVGGGVISAGA